MIDIPTITISSVSEFINQIETRLVDNYRVTIFRGQNTDKALIPKIARHYFKKSREIDERRMLDEFNIHSIQYLSYFPNNDLERLTIAQHHGLPTRLLDWTDNALAALFFAVNNEPNDNESAVVWILSVERGSEMIIDNTNIEIFEQVELKLFKPASIISRVTSQSGWFSLHPYRGDGQFQRADIKYQDEIRLNKISIKKGASQSILKTLESCGVNEHSIFRDLDSLGKYVFRKYRS